MASDSRGCRPIRAMIALSVHSPPGDTGRAMSHDKDRAFAEQVTEAVNDRDLEWMRSTFHPNVEFRSALAASEGGFYRGVDGMQQYFADVDSAWSDFAVELREVRRVAEELVVTYRITGLSRSGVPLDAAVVQVWTWRDGKLWRNRSYTSEAEALEAVGLRE